MAIKIKSAAEIAILRENAQLLQEILQKLVNAARAGVSTLDLDRLAGRWIEDLSGRPSFKGYRVGRFVYPANICTSLGPEVVHGIPRAARILQPGDVLSIDIGMIRHGFCADLATTVIVEDAPRSLEEKRVVRVAEEALWKGIENAVAGRRVGDISHAIQSYVNSQGLSVVTNFVGHGIGREMHEEPQVPNYGSPGQGPLLRAGMVLCIEPMVANGEKDLIEVEVQEDNWTAVAPGATVAAHFEAMVLVREGAPPELLGLGVLEPALAGISR
ncbi:MAG: type I methionyl aminopeptidase [Candidatus Bipolaricaulota bacterium]|nr:type I methionyl aminopeptidase [Candidatus Bipolaricaulota bacterium]